MSLNLFSWIASLVRRLFGGGPPTPSRSSSSAPPVTPISAPATAPPPPAPPLVAAGPVTVREIPDGIRLVDFGAGVYPDSWDQLFYGADKHPNDSSYLYAAFRISRPALGFRRLDEKAERITFPFINGDPADVRPSKTSTESVDNRTGLTGLPKPDALFFVAVKRGKEPKVKVQVLVEAARLVLNGREIASAQFWRTKGRNVPVPSPKWWYGPEGFFEVEFAF